MDLGLVILKEFWLETVMVRCSGDQMDFGLAVSKSMFLGPSDGSTVG